MLYVNKIDLTPSLDPFTPDPFTPDPFTPDPFTPDPFTPDPFTPDPFTPDPFTPDPFTPLLSFALVIAMSFPVFPSMPENEIFLLVSQGSIIVNNFRSTLAGIMAMAKNLRIKYNCR